MKPKSTYASQRKCLIFSGPSRARTYIFYRADYQLFNHSLQSWSPVWTPHFPRDENIPIMQAFAGICTAQQGSNYIFYLTDYQLLNHPLQSWSPVWTPHFPRDENIPIMQAFAGIRKLVIFLRFESRSH
jgi:hypothetical protein